MIFDPLFLIFVGPTMLIALWTQYKVKSTFRKYSQIPINSKLTGAQIARYILDSQGLQKVRIVKHRGVLSDHYDPTHRVLRLSHDVHDGSSISSAGVAAHEAGHGIQHANRYAMLGLRSAIVPFASVGSWLSFPMIFVGMIINLVELIWIGIGLFSILVFFQLVTLPTEFDASRRAKQLLSQYNLVTREELDGVASVLTAAAMTYVAATAQAIGTLVYFIYRVRR